MPKRPQQTDINAAQPSEAGFNMLPVDLSAFAPTAAAPAQAEPVEPAEPVEQAEPAQVTTAPAPSFEAALEFEPPTSATPVDAEQAALVAYVDSFMALNPTASVLAEELMGHSETAADAQIMLAAWARQSGHCAVLKVALGVDTESTPDLQAQWDEVNSQWVCARVGYLLAGMTLATFLQMCRRAIMVADASVATVPPTPQALQQDMMLDTLAASTGQPLPPDQSRVAQFVNGVNHAQPSSVDFSNGGPRGDNGAGAAGPGDGGLGGQWAWDAARGAMVRVGA